MTDISFKVHAHDFGRGLAHVFERLGATQGTPIHFAHATAFPPLSYRRFLAALAPEQPLFGLGHRSIWPSQEPAPPASYRWRDSAEDLIAFLDDRSQAVIGVGHSFGAVISIMAAAKRPDLFKALILIEPGLFSQEMVIEAETTPLEAQQRGRLIQKTLARPDRFKDAQACFDFHRPKRAFAGLSDEVLWDYCTAGSMDTQGALRLLYPKAWEAHIYRTPPYIWPELKALQVPVMGVRAAKSQTLQPWMWRQWALLRPQDKLVELDELSHLAPLDAPKRLAKVCTETISAFLT